MACRDEIIQHLREYLRVDEFKDYGPQGLQVEGREEVAHVVTGVSACVDLFEQAIGAGADMILTHHGILWDFDSRVVRGAFKRRLQLLLDQDITLAGYHLCLDAHDEVGNNILAARGLGLENVEGFADRGGLSIGFQGEWQEVLSPADALQRVSKLYGSDPVAFLEGPAEVRRVGIISGGAQKEIYTAIEAGLDLFITGEASEFVLHAAREGGIHFIGAGHHATERLGIRALGEYVAERFGVRHTFIDVPNPV